MERILIIDDDKINIKLTKFILEKAGYEVMSTHSGATGIEILRELRFDLVLLDIKMPDMNGIDVLRRIRSYPEIAKTKVIFLTSSNSPTDLTEAAHLDAIQFIQKPFLPESLLHVIQETFERKDDALMLIVDDDAINRKVTQHVFDSHFRVRTAETGEQALAFVRQTAPDIILMDLYLPDMDGLETFAKIRQLERGGRVPVVFMTVDGSSDVEHRILQAGAADFIRKPFIAEAVRERVKRIVELERLQTFLHEEVDRRTREVLESSKKIVRLSEQIIFALANAIDAKDAYTKGHSSRVADYSRKIAQQMGKNEDECRDIYYAAMLHDVGKIGVPREIINKATRLSDEEFSAIKDHTVVGERILRTISELPRLSIGARWHHERYDGKGYPDGLSGKDIPEIARIICVADCYDAMTSNRSYRGALSQEIVRDEISLGKNRQFDPDIADIMLSMIDEDVEYTMREH